MLKPDLPPSILAQPVNRQFVCFPCMLSPAFILVSQPCKALWGGSGQQQGILGYDPAAISGCLGNDECALRWHLQITFHTHTSKWCVSAFESLEMRHSQQLPYGCHIVRLLHDGSYGSTWKE